MKGKENRKFQNRINKGRGGRERERETERERQRERQRQRELDGQLDKTAGQRETETGKEGREGAIQIQGKSSRQITGETGKSRESPRERMIFSEAHNYPINQSINFKINCNSLHQDFTLDQNPKTNIY